MTQSETYSNTHPEDAGAVNKDIAARIRELRDVCDMEQSELAQTLGLSVEEYRRYEDGEKDFPVSFLYELASLFKVDLTELLTGTAPRLANCSIVRKGEGIAVDRYEGYDFESIAYKFIGRKIEPMIVTVGPETEFAPPELVSHSGQEFNFVLEGQITVLFGERRFLLNEGDCFYFDPTVPHAQCASGGKKARFLTVIMP
ncbi:MAG: cupin domain-containing protein [Clostridia bacterium]|nr:cupin domain-containing protein [Clostridia bacterium]